MTTSGESRQSLCHVGRGGLCIWNGCPANSTKGHTPAQCPLRRCHGGHPFVPGIDVDAPDQPKWDWCNTCGEADSHLSQLTTFCGDDR